MLEVNITLVFFLVRYGSKLTIKTPELRQYVLQSLLLTLNNFYTFSSVCIVDFEHVFFSWVYTCIFVFWLWVYIFLFLVNLSSVLDELIFNPANIYFSKVNNRNPRRSCEIRSKLTRKTPERPKLPSWLVSVWRQLWSFWCFYC